MVCFAAMTSNEVGVLMGAVQWGEEGSYVREVASRGNLPQLAKVIKGQYLAIGAPSLASPGVTPTILLLSAGKSVRIAAQCVKFKEGRRVVPVGPKLAIPDTYEGYFEILSEDGRAVRCIESVGELAKRFPDSCLVRESVKVFVSRSEEIDSITERSRTLQVGETLVLVGEVVGSKNGKTQQRYLRCFDQSGQNIYLPFDAKGKFSAIAKEENISGVHSIKNLLNKRLPLMVRLIYGRPPTGHKIASQFLPELRLFAAFNEEALAALPLGKESAPVLLPPSAPLKLSQAKNAEQLSKSKEFGRLCERSTSLLHDLSQRIHVYDINTGSKHANGVKDPRFLHLPEQAKQRSKQSQSHQHRIHHSKRSSDKVSVSKKQSSAKTDDYDEIDQIYDYVRGFAPLPKHIKPQFSGDHERLGKRPSSSVKSHEKVDLRPTPPPIETIPTRRPSTQEKLSPSVHPALISAVLEKAERKVEKRSRGSDEKKGVPLHIIDTSPHNILKEKSSNKLFIKASQQKTSKTRIFRHKSASPVKDSLIDIVNPSPNLDSNLTLNHLPNQVISTTRGASPSPLFKLRYKSLTNLAMDFDTLDSSTSGDKGSAGSCGSVALRSKIPEKRIRRLHRPKSLTNLVWDGRGGSAGVECPSGGFGGLNTTARALLEAERKMRLEPGVYRHARDSPALLAATTRMLASQKKIGTLYL